MQNNDQQIDLGGLSFQRRLFSIFLRHFFKLLYHQFAWCYDLVAWVVSLGNWQKWVLSAIPYLKGPRVLEIGFGTGHLQLAAAQQAIVIFGLDESYQMTQITQARLTHHGFHPRVLRGDADKLPFMSESFSTIVMTFPSEYIFKPDTMAEIKRILVIGGRVVVLPLAWITGRSPLERLVAWINHITGQAPEWNPQALEPLIPAGFELAWEETRLSRSKLIIIQLIKVG